MGLKNKSMYAILGILSISPGTGYDIKKYCDTVLSNFWNENFGHIYPTLRKLLSDGRIEVVSHARAENKITYRITEQGRRELHAWLAQDSEQQPIRSEFLLKLLFSSDQPRDDVIATLEKHKAEHNARIGTYRAMQRAVVQGIPQVSKERAVFLNAVLRRGVLSSEAVMQWCDETIEALKSADNPSLV